MAERADAPQGLGKRMHALRGARRLAAIGEVVGQWRESGKSQAAFSRDVGVAAVTLGRWRRQVEAATASPSKQPVFADLGTHEIAHEAAFEVVLTAGIVLRVPAGFRDTDLIRLLGVLSSAC